MTLSPEPLAYWYLRLNGFFTIPNFVVHPDMGSEQGTDVDALGVRFPYRAENLTRPMRDDPLLVSEDQRIHFVLAEVKNGQASINVSWLNARQPNILRTIRAAGITLPARSEEVAAQICSTGAYVSASLRAEVVCLCERRSVELSRRLPQARQITWEQVMTFVYLRFRAYFKQKRSHGQWDETGQLLWDLMAQSRDPNDYITKLRRCWQQTS